MDEPRPSRSPREISVSFEFFPPKTPEMETALWDSIARLAPLKPSFVSVTYGAGGSTRERTHATLARVLGETTLKPAAHLTCVAATRADTTLLRDLVGYVPQTPIADGVKAFVDWFRSQT